MPSVETVLLVIAVLFLISILASKASVRLGVPALLLFVGIGMLAGSDGPGGIYFDHPWATQLVGVSALTVILFAAGFETRLDDLRPVLGPATALATIGVLVSTALMGGFIAWVFELPLLHGLLVGAIVTSTDAAAVLSVLRSRRLQLRHRLHEILEFESGSNDPMAVLLTIVLLHLLTHSGVSAWFVGWMLAKQVLIGLIVGFGVGHASAVAINRIRLEWEGLYPVLSMTIALLAYAGAASLGGSGFLSVYLAGLILGNKNLIHRTSLRLFNDGIAWLMQITMFLVLGLQVFPSRLPAVTRPGLLIAAFLILVARPLSVFAALSASKLPYKAKLFISWAGLRGAVPVVLATFPLLAGIKEAETIFSVVFFVAITSLLIQGTTLPAAARLLGLDMPAGSRPAFPLQFNPAELTESTLAELKVGSGSAADGKRIMDLGLPKGTLVVLLARSKQFIAPGGSTILRAGDVISVLTTQTQLAHLRSPIEGASE